MIKAYQFGDQLNMTGNEDRRRGIAFYTDASLKFRGLLLPLEEPHWNPDVFETVRNRLEGSLMSYEDFLREYTSAGEGGELHVTQILLQVQIEGVNRFLPFSLRSYLPSTSPAAAGSSSGR